jgi:hypothetical protein
MVDFTCAYEYDPTDKDSLASGVGLPPFMSGLAALSGKPLARVCSHIVRTTQGFQVRRGFSLGFKRTALSWVLTSGLV